jgi:hypothetical protein
LLIEVYCYEENAFSYNSDCVGNAVFGFLALKTTLGDAGDGLTAIYTLSNWTDILTAAAEFMWEDPNAVYLRPGL